MKAIISFLSSVIMVSGLVTSCKYRDNSRPGHSEKPLLSFKKFKGLSYTEVRREQNGLSFNRYGYHLNPDWKLRFVSNDSIALYSPERKQFLNFPLSCGIDSFFNTNRTFFRLKHMSKDSLKFELIAANNDSLEIKGTKVYMLFYADNYIKETLHSDATTLQRSSRRDSLFVKALIKRADSSNVNAFAALDPVQLSSTKPSVKVTKRKTVADFLLNNYNTSDDYMSPTYDILISKVPESFYYSFSAYVDKEGKMYYNEPLVPFTGEGYRIKYVRESTAVMDTYLKKHLKVIPGETLGAPHASVIYLHVRGKRS